MAVALSTDVVAGLGAEAGSQGKLGSTASGPGTAPAGLWKGGLAAKGPGVQAEAESFRARWQSMLASLAEGSAEGELAGSRSAEVHEAAQNAVGASPAGKISKTLAANTARPGTAADPPTPPGEVRRATLPSGTEEEEIPRADANRASAVTETALTDSASVQNPPEKSSSRAQVEHDHKRTLNTDTSGVAVAQPGTLSTLPASASAAFAMDAAAPVQVAPVQAAQTSASDSRVAADSSYRSGAVARTPHQPGAGSASGTTGKPGGSKTGVSGTGVNQVQGSATEGLASAAPGEPSGASEEADSLANAPLPAADAMRSQPGESAAGHEGRVHLEAQAGGATDVSARSVVTETGTIVQARPSDAADSAATVQLQTGSAALTSAPAAHAAAQAASRPARSTGGAESAAVVSRKLVAQPMPGAAVPLVAGNPAGVHGGVHLAAEGAAGGPAASAATGSHETFAALDAEPGAGVPAWIHAGPQHAEAGFQDPALGWVGVRADLSGGGVHAAIVPGSADAAQLLGGHLAGLSAHLAAEHIPVQSLSMAAAGRDSTGSQQGSMQQGGGQGQGRSPGSDPGAPHRSAPNASPIALAHSGPSRAELQEGGAIEPVLGGAAAKGAHISVMA